LSNRPKRVNPRPSRLQPRQQQQDRSRRTRVLIWGALGLLVAVAVVIGVAVADSSSGGDGVETGFAETLGDPLPPDDDTDDAVGLLAPSFRAQTTQNTDVVDVITDDGTVRAIGFFTHWCSHCRAEVPRVSKWLADNDVPAGVELVAVSTSVDAGAPNYPPSAWFEREDWPGDVLSDSDQDTIATAYGLANFPYWVLVDGDGLVVERFTGELTEAEFTAFMDRAEAAVA